MFSILLLTHNEEHNIKECLESVSWCDDVWIVDSGSTDRTLEIARAMGANILSHPFESFGKQRNWGLDNARFKHQWIFHLDADERFTPALQAECCAVARLAEHSGYFVANKTMLLGKWIKHASGYPVYQMRFHKLGEVRFIDVGHGQREGEALHGFGYMKEPYIHYNFSKGLADWFAKHVRYALAEAQETLRSQQGAGATRPADALSRRRALKRFASKLPCRSWLKLFYLLFVKGGILDGPAGWLYCRMQAHYEFMCATILEDLKRSRA